MSFCLLFDILFLIIQIPILKCLLSFRTFDDLKKSAAVKVTPTEPSPTDVSVAEVEIEDEKPVLSEVPKEPEVTDVIVEEETPSNTDSATEVKSENQSEGECSTIYIFMSLLISRKLIVYNYLYLDAVEEKPKDTTEEEEPEKKPEEKTEGSESEIVPDRPPVPPTPAPTAPIEGPQPEPAASTPPDITDVPIASASNLPSKAAAEEAAPVSTEVKAEVEPEVKMQIVEEPGKKLTDILSWLHNEPPLTPEQLALLCVEEQDFDVALKSVQPSAKREGFATVPDVTWDDIGSLQDIRHELQMTILVSRCVNRLIKYFWVKALIFFLLLFLGTYQALCSVCESRLNYAYWCIALWTTRLWKNIVG